MRKSTSYVSATVIAGAFALLSMTASAATFTVDCDAAEQVQPVLDGASRGDTVTINGTCIEEIVLRSGITIEGSAAGGTIISGNTDTGTAVRVVGRNTRISNLVIGLARTGILLLRTASATIEGGAVVLSGTGISASQSSHATIRNVLVSQNESGIVVNQSSGADITDSTVSDNTGSGILILEGSAADIIGNTIQNNTNDGVLVSRNSTADFANDTIAGTTPNTISGNSRRGIACVLNSSVRFDLPQIFGAGNGATGTENFVPSGCSFSGSPT